MGRKNSVIIIIVASLLVMVSTAVFSDEAKLTTIMPNDTVPPNVTRLNNASVGTTYYNDPATYPIPTSGLLVEGQIALGHGKSGNSRWLATGPNFGLFTLNDYGRPMKPDSTYPAIISRRHYITMMNKGGNEDYWHIATANNATVPTYTEALQIRHGDNASGSDKTLLTILGQNGYGSGVGRGWVGVGTERPQGILDLNPETGSATGALIVPRVDYTVISNPFVVEGTIIYNTKNPNKGLYIYEGTSWKQLSYT